MAIPDAGPAARNRILRVLLPVLLTCLLADQASKAWASSRADEPRVLVPGYLVAYSVPNAGTVLGLGREHAVTGTAFALLGIAVAARLAWVAYADRVRWRGGDWLACALLLAGIFGNTIDRLALGYVRDFLVTWAIPTLVFNVADLLVVVGAAALLMARYYDHRAGRAAVALG